MKKLYNECGQVAIAVSYGFGAGWSTWNEVSPLDKRYNELILEKRWDEAESLASLDGHYSGGLRDCEIEWLDEGIAFNIHDYDGSESLETLSNLSQTT